MLVYKSREVDYGNGTQYVELANGKVTKQWLEGKGHHYTGNGNPELVGKTDSELKGYGFRKVSQSRHDFLMTQD